MLYDDFDPEETDEFGIFRELLSDEGGLWQDGENNNNVSHLSKLTDRNNYYSGVEFEILSRSPSAQSIDIYQEPSNRPTSAQQFDPVNLLELVTDYFSSGSDVLSDIRNNQNDSLQHTTSNRRKHYNVNTPVHWTNQNASSSAAASIDNLTTLADKSLWSVDGDNDDVADDEAVREFERLEIALGGTGTGDERTMVTLVNPNASTCKATESEEKNTGAPTTSQKTHTRECRGRRKSLIPIPTSRSSSLSRPGSRSSSRASPTLDTVRIDDNNSPSMRHTSASGNQSKPNESNSIGSHRVFRTRSLSVGLSSDEHHELRPPIRYRRSYSLERSRNDDDKRKNVEKRNENHASSRLVQAGSLSLIECRGQLKARFLAEIKERKRQQETAKQLQRNYESLLQKHAEKELTIEQLRLGARVNLVCDPPAGSHFETGSVARPQKAVAVDFAKLGSGTMSVATMAVNSGQQRCASASLVSIGSALPPAGRPASESSVPSYTYSEQAKPRTEHIDISSNKQIPAERNPVANELDKLWFSSAGFIQTQMNAFEILLDQDETLKIDEQRKVLSNLRRLVDKLHSELNQRDQCTEGPCAEQHEEFTLLEIRFSQLKSRVEDNVNDKMTAGHDENAALNEANRQLPATETIDQLSPRNENALHNAITTKELQMKPTVIDCRLEPLSRNHDNSIRDNSLPEHGPQPDSSTKDDFDSGYLGSSTHSNRASTVSDFHNKSRPTQRVELSADLPKKAYPSTSSAFESDDTVTEHSKSIKKDKVISKSMASRSSNRSHDKMMKDEQVYPLKTMHTTIPPVTFQTGPAHAFSTVRPSYYNDALPTNNGSHQHWKALPSHHVQIESSIQHQPAAAPPQAPTFASETSRWQDPRRPTSAMPTNTVHHREHFRNHYDNTLHSSNSNQWQRENHKSIPSHHREPASYWSLGDHTYHYDRGNQYTGESMSSTGRPMQFTRDAGVQNVPLMTTTGVQHMTNPSGAVSWRQPTWDTGSSSRRTDQHQQKPVFITSRACPLCGATNYHAHVTPQHSTRFPEAPLPSTTFATHAMNDGLKDNDNLNQAQPKRFKTKVRYYIREYEDEPPKTSGNRRSNRNKKHKDANEKDYRTSSPSLDDEDDDDTQMALSSSLAEAIAIAKQLRSRSNDIKNSLRRDVHQTQRAARQRNRSYWTDS